VFAQGEISFPFALWIQLAQLTISILSVLTETAGTGIRLPLSHFQHRGKKKVDWIAKSQEKKPPNIRREPCGSLKKPTTVVVRRWEAKGMFQSAAAVSLPMPSRTWPWGAHKAPVFLLTVGDYSTGSLAEKMCSRKSPRQRERENKQWAPWCHFYSHYSDSSHAFYMALRVNNLEQIFFGCGKGCSFQLCYSIDKHNAKANKGHKTGRLITTCLPPITPITLEATGPMNSQHSANKKLNINCPNSLFQEKYRNIQSTRGEITLMDKIGWTPQITDSTVMGHCRRPHYVKYVY